MDENKESKIKIDKIFNNKYNTGEIEFKHFGAFSIDGNWLNDQQKGFSDDQEKFENVLLQENIYKIFNESELRKKYPKNKKVKKDDVLKIFNFFIERLDEPERYSYTEKFIEIANFMNINFKILYNSLSTSYKEQILKELNNKYNIFKKKNIHRLF